MSENRQKVGIITSAVGIFLNILLFAGKFIAGLLSKSVAVIADAFNNLSDAAASIISILGFKLSSKSPDREHPYGHGRMEYIAGLIVSFLILVMGWELLKSAVNSIINPQKLNTSLVTVIILTSSILVKIFMFVMNLVAGKKINSPALIATAKDSLSDVISTGAVLAIVIVTIIFPNIKIPLDGIAGIIVALLVLWNGIQSTKETMDPLLGLPPDVELVKAIEEEILTHKPIVGIHDLIVHDYGPGRLFITVHAEVPGNQNIFDLHEIIDQTECALDTKFNCLSSIHLDPIDLNNPEVAKVKKYISDVAKKLHPEITIHDLRIVPGENNTNIIFDAIKPYSCKLTDFELTKFLFDKVREYNNHFTSVIKIDKPFC